MAVERDPKEKGERALLNFGHTLGHAIEKLKDFTWLHGECVSVGCCLAAEISCIKGNISNNNPPTTANNIFILYIPSLSLNKY